MDRHVRIAFAPSILRGHFFTFIVIAFYVALLVLPWMFTCILNYRPIDHSSYYDAGGDWFWQDYSSLDKWAEGLAFLNGVQAVLAIPLTSFILARAAVVYAQTRSAGAKPLTAAETFALADRRWEDVLVPSADWLTTGPPPVQLGALFLLLGT